MKKYLLPLLCFCVSINYSLAQNQFGVRIAPGLSYTRINANPDTTDFVSDGVSPQIGIGGFYDWSIKSDYYISTGLLLVSKKASIKTNRLSIIDHYKLTYLQVPLLLKLYTGEIRLDTKLYFELGPIGGIKIKNQIKKQEQAKAFIEAFRVLELGGLFGFGIEYNISLFTSVYLGMSYQIGLSSIFRKQRDIVGVSPISGYADFISINFGIKF